ncbi:PFL family protein [Steroidobacter agaridevorans]|uniref:PFL family protein n=1 Tax=Steroidobacter agaridevorans TaxID=2695856 RepID=A0A829Y4Y5_9GAMM|nr:PFL family protein [Steroidobacter agaridevorans]
MNPVRVRTITAGVELSPALELDRVEAAVAFLTRARRAFESAGYEVQTVRVAVNPVIASLTPAARDQALDQLRRIDELVASQGAIFNIGPILTEDRSDDSLVEWSQALVKGTQSISFSTAIATPEGGVLPKVAATTAKIMIALANALADGMANFRFAAAANIPPGTPFFPVAWHQGPASFALGLEGASVVERAFASMRTGDDPTEKLRSALNEVLTPVERLANELAQRERRQYLGIDTSPAPAKDRSIAAAIEALTRTPFGSAGTLEACSIVTAALKSVSVRTCGYSGLMLPVLEDPLLAQRAGENRYSIRDVLLYSSVCGTGLDVVPIPGNTSPDSIDGLLRDVASLATRLRKPLSARLFLVPGKKAGDLARFDDPVLTDSVVMKLD